MPKNKKGIAETVKTPVKKRRKRRQLSPRTPSAESSCKAALDALSKRYAKAIEDLAYHIERVNALRTEIPSLERSIMALNSQLNPGRQVPYLNVMQENVIPIPGVRNVAPGNGATYQAMDLSGMGSTAIPTQQIPDESHEEISEDHFLSMAEGSMSTATGEGEESLLDEDEEL